MASLSICHVNGPRASQAGCHLVNDCQCGCLPSRTCRTPNPWNSLSGLEVAWTANCRFCRGGLMTAAKSPVMDRPYRISWSKEGCYVTRVEDRVIDRPGPALRHFCLTSVECRKRRMKRSCRFQRQRSRIDRRVLPVSGMHIGAGLTGSIRLSSWDRTITCRRIARTDAAREGFETASGKAGVAAHIPLAKNVKQDPRRVGRDCQNGRCFCRCARGNCTFVIFQFLILLDR